MRSISNGRALIYTRIANDDALWAHRLPGNRVSATYLQNLGVFRLGWARPSPPSPLSLTRARGSSLSTQTKHTPKISNAPSASSASIWSRAAPAYSPYPARDPRSSRSFSFRDRAG